METGKKRAAGAIGAAADRQRLLDITQQEDLSMAVMNLISLEEHLFFTINKTGNELYLSLLGPVRKLRTALLRDLLANTEGENWCMAKHLLAATMRTMEVGTKHLESDPARAHDYFRKAFDTYGVFWFLQKIGRERDAAGRPGNDARQVEADAAKDD